MKIAYEQIARKYARAFLRVNHQRMNPDVVAAMVAFVADCRDQRQQFFYVWLSSMSIFAKKEIIRTWARRHNLNDLLDSLIKLLAEQGRLLLFIDVIEQIIIVHNEKQGIVEVRCFTAQPLLQEQLTNIRDFLNRLTGKTIVLVPVIDSSLIAGIRLQSETFLWEYSVAQQLQAMCASC